MLACAQGEKAVRAFLPRLQEAHAQALRLGDAASCRACAALCARWLWTARPSACRASPRSEIMIDRCAGLMI